MVGRECGRGQGGVGGCGKRQGWEGWQDRCVCVVRRFRSRSIAHAQCFNITNGLLNVCRAVPKVSAASLVLPIGRGEPREGVSDGVREGMNERAGDRRVSE